MSRFHPTTDVSPSTSNSQYTSSGIKIPSKIGKSRTNALVQRFSSMSPENNNKSITPTLNSSNSLKPTDSLKLTKQHKTNVLPSESTSTLKTETEKRKKRKKDKRINKQDDKNSNSQIHNEDGEVVANSSTIRKSGQRKPTTSIEVVTPTDSPKSTENFYLKRYVMHI